MLVFSVLSLLVSFTLAASCCPRPLSTKEAYQQSEVVFYATVKDGTVVEAGGTATLTLEVSEIFKGSPAQAASLQEGLVHSKVSCPALPVAKGKQGVFFGTISQASHGVVAVSLRPCDPNRAFNDCELNNLRKGEFSSSCSSVPIPSTPSSTGKCDCRGSPSTYTTGTFNCEICSCGLQNHGGVNTCVTTCTISSTCVLAPSIIGSTLLVVAFICVMIAIRRRQRKNQESSEVELSDISESTNSSYTYQPVMTSPPVMTNNQMLMTTPQGQVLVNTQPMYMMTQTGEPVVVQVAYM